MERVKAGALQRTVSCLLLFPRKFSSVSWGNVDNSKSRNLFGGSFYFALEGIWVCTNYYFKNRQSNAENGFYQFQICIWKDNYQYIQYIR